MSGVRRVKRRKLVVRRRLRGLTQSSINPLLSTPFMTPPGVTISGSFSPQWISLLPAFFRGLQAAKRVQTELAIRIFAEEAAKKGEEWGVNWLRENPEKKDPRPSPQVRAILERLNPPAPEILALRNHPAAEILEGEVNFLRRAITEAEMTSRPENSVDRYEPTPEFAVQGKTYCAQLAPVKHWVDTPKGKVATYCCLDLGHKEDHRWALRWKGATPEMNPEEAE